MAKYKNLIDRNQIADKAISEVELDVVLQGKITQITANQTAIANIMASKAAANGIATLGADGFVPTSQLRAGSIAEYLGEVATVAALTSVTTAGRGDVVDVVPAGDPDNSQSYFLFGDDPTVAGDWRPVLSPKDGVTSLRNASGTQTGLNGIVTLADVAMSGQAGDVAFSHASYAANDVSGALVEVRGVADQNTQDISNNVTSINNLSTAVGSKVGMTGFSPYVELTGDITGHDFTSAVDLAGAKVMAYLGGQLVHPNDYSLAGNVVTFTETPDKEYRRPALMVLKAA